MALGKFASKDWFAGFLVALTSGAGKNSVYVPAVTLTSSAGVEYGPANPLSVSGGTAGSLIVGQYKLTTSATTIAGPTPLKNGIVVTAKATNAGTVFLGGATVTTTNDGTGNGYALIAGASIALPISNLSLIYAIGTANDVITYGGN
jgi:hypothetical protein